MNHFTLLCHSVALIVRMDR